MWCTVLVRLWCALTSLRVLFLTAGSTLLERQGHLPFGCASAGDLVLYVACELV